MLILMQEIAQNFFNKQRRKKRMPHALKVWGHLKEKVDGNEKEAKRIVDSNL